MQNNDLISRKALIEDLMNLEVVGGHKMYRKGCDHTLHVLVPEMINAHPAIDAAQVVHGHWEKSNIPHEKYCCSVCGGACWYYDYEGDVARSRYCPNCGAKMDK